MIVLTTYHLASKLSSRNQAMLSSFLVSVYVSYPVFGTYWIRMDSFMVLFAACGSDPTPTPVPAKAPAAAAPKAAPAPTATPKPAAPGV